MAIERKYGRFPVRGIPDDEPVFLFRAQDELVPQVIDFYRALCSAAGSPPEHLDGLDASRAEIVAWRDGHFTKTPGVRDMGDDD